MTGPLSGIYAIENRVSGGFYVGSSRNLPKRLRGHRNLLERGVHHNKHLQSAWAKYGADAFTFEPIYLVAPDDLFAVETRLLERLAPLDRCYNTSRNAFAPTRGLRASEETRAKYRARRHSVETRKKMAASQLAVWDARSLEDRAQFGERISKGKRLFTDEEYLVRRRAMRRATAIGDDTSTRMCSQEYRERMGEVKKAEWAARTPEFRETHRQQVRARKKSPESVARGWETRRRNAALRETS